MQFIRALVKHEGLIEKLATQPSAGSWVLAKMWESSIADVLGIAQKSTSHGIGSSGGIAQDNG